MQFHHKIDTNENGGQFMCGIIGYAGLCNISNSVLIEGLEALEYRGYDSAGVAVVHDGEVQVVKAKGKVSFLKEKM